MKTWKQGIFGILAIIALTFAFTACDDGNGKDDGKEQPQDWEDTIALFSNLTATVKGISLLPSEWNGVANKVATIINNAREQAVGPTKGDFGVFGWGTEIEIVVSKTGVKCQVIDGNWTTLYLNLAFVNAPDLQKIIEAVGALAAAEGGYIFE